MKLRRRIFAVFIRYYDPYRLQTPPPMPPPQPVPTPPPYSPTYGPTPTPGPSPQPLTPIQKAGLILTGIVTTVGIIAAEVTLVILEIEALALGPAGVAFDVLIVTPIELFLIDVDIALWVMIHRSLMTGEKQPVILLPLWGLEK